MNVATREGWLASGVLELGGWIRHAANLDAPGLYVSVGFPKGGRGTIGQCWSGELSADGLAHVFIHPALVDPARVLDVLLHEMIHATVGTEAGHRRPFAKVAGQCGLVAPWKATTASPELADALGGVAAKLGPYPHAALVPKVKGKGPGSRMRLWECQCPKPQKIRAASDDLDVTCNRCDAPFAQQDQGEE